MNTQTQQTKEFSNVISIGDKFLFNGKKNFLCEVVDIIDCHSRAKGEITGQMYLAKEINGLTTNTFDVAKSTIVRHKIS